MLRNTAVMTYRSALTLLLVVALLTPVASILGLYDTTMEQLMSFAAPALGAIGAILGSRLVARLTR